MRTTVATSLLFASMAFVVASGTASADARKARTYKIKFTEVANTCEGTGISLTRAKMEVAPIGKKRGVSVSIQLIPVMKGRAGKKGKFNARAKKGKTGIAGLDGKFSVSGAISKAGAVELIFFAEYYRGSTPLCTTSWKGEGAPAK